MMSEYISLGALPAPSATTAIRQAKDVKKMTKAAPSASDYLRLYGVWKDKGSLTRSEAGSSDLADILNILFPHKNDVTWAPPVGMHKDVLKVYNHPAYQEFLKTSSAPQSEFDKTAMIIGGVAVVGLVAALLLKRKK